MPSPVGMQEPSSRLTLIKEMQGLSFSMWKRSTSYEVEVIWVADDPLIINEKGSNFGILRRDEEERLFLDAKELKDQTFWGKEVALSAKGREIGGSIHIKEGKIELKRPEGAEGAQLW